jgi:hypothetical protein
MSDLITILGITKIVNGVTIGVTPQIDVGLNFTVDRLNTPTCETILRDAYSSPNVNTFLDAYKLNPSTSNIITNIHNCKTTIDSDGVQMDTEIDITSGSLAGAAGRRLDFYLHLLESSSIPALRLVNNCLKENNSYNLEAIEKQKELTDESKLRLETVKDPETKVSYYEGWFPLFRPMSEPALFGIFTTAVFLLILSIGIFLRMSGIQFSITLPTVFVGGPGLDTKKYVMIGLGVGALAGLGVYGYNKGWFGKKDK